MNPMSSVTVRRHTTTSAGCSTAVTPEQDSKLVQPLVLAAMFDLVRSK
jgi:hypothetical protein